MQVMNRIGGTMLLGTLLAACGGGADAADPGIAAAAGPAPASAARGVVGARGPSPTVDDAAIATRTLGCTQSVYDSGSGMYAFEPRGFIDLHADGTYAYRGFEQPSKGSTAAAADGILRFEGGHLDGGEAVPITGRPGRYTLTAPAIGDRWSCGGDDA